MAVPHGYNLNTLVQWLWYKYRCQECTSSEFQRLFEEIIKRANPDFMRIRPYGNIGDRKADGLLRTEGTVFQVYSPDEYKQAELVGKINEDLDGAVREWKDGLKKWVFVYNVRRGIPPDIPLILNEKKKQYPNIEIEEISSDKLWEIARGLSEQQRAEILGSPIGYESLFIKSEASLASSSSDSTIVLIQDVLNPIDIQSVLDAIKPANIFGAPVFIRPDTTTWEGASKYQEDLLSGLFEKCRQAHPSRFAVFSLAPIPLITQLGFLLTYSVSVQYYKFHVDTQSWLWPQTNSEQKDIEFTVEGLPKDVIMEPCDVVIRASISSEIGKYETDEVITDAPIQIDIKSANPSLTWLRNEKQVHEFGRVIRNLLSEIRKKIPYCREIHLFMACAAPLALIAGQQINPRMTPPVRLYQYSRQTTPRYQYAITLE